VQVADEGPLVVTTAEDAVANDGELSLREAVEAANARAGADTIGFADGLRGGTLVLEQGTLAVTDDLTIDGDPDDGGRTGSPSSSPTRGPSLPSTAAPASGRWMPTCASRT
jgi:CSLREA domain-containing protein